MGLSFWHLLIVVLVVVVVFGAGKLPQVMGDLGKGVRNFKSGLDGNHGDGADEKFAARPVEDKIEKKDS